VCELGSSIDAPPVCLSRSGAEVDGKRGRGTDGFVRPWCPFLPGPAILTLNGFIEMQGLSRKCE